MSDSGKSFPLAIAEAYEMYFVRDITKLATGLLVALCWLSFVLIWFDFSPNIGFLSIRFLREWELVSAIALIAFSYFLGVFLQELFSLIRVFPLSPNIDGWKRSGKGHNSYDAVVLTIREERPEAIRVLERIVISKHFASSIGIVFANLTLGLLISAFIPWVMPNSGYYVGGAVLGLLAFLACIKICRRKLDDQKLLIEFLRVKIDGEKGTQKRSDKRKPLVNKNKK